jgi:hypothetical protein
MNGSMNGATASPKAIADTLYNKLLKIAKIISGVSRPKSA